MEHWAWGLIFAFGWIFWKLDQIEKAIAFQRNYLFNKFGPTTDD